MSDLFCGVHILDAPYSVDKIYDYFIPEKFRENLSRGSVVSVPFGQGNKSSLAVIFELKDKIQYEKYKEITDVQREITLPSEMLALSVFMKEQCFCSVGEALKSAFPFYAFGQMEDFYYPAKCDNNQNDFVKYIIDNPGVSGKKLEELFGKKVFSTLNKLCENGIVVKKTEIKESKKKYEKIILLNISAEKALNIVNGEDEIKLRSSKMKSVLSALVDAKGRLSETELRGVCGCEHSQIKSLTEKGVLKTENAEISRDPYSGKIFSSNDGGLTPHQQDAFQKINALYETGEPQAVLLHGITGSGKTRVIKAVIDRALQDNRGAIILVPEISLTPQTVGVFKGYYGDRVAVIHSSLSGGERFDEWRKINSGEATVCIGTRSAVFAPVKNLGLIVIDEEQENTYKSENSPRYHARDIARFRAAYNKGLMLLSSATPSMESYHKAKSGVYHLVELKERYGNAVLPETKIADMKTDLATVNAVSAIGHTLYDELCGVLERKEQAILFINRRGYNNFLSCTMCGKSIMCPHCSVSMTFHSPGRVFADEGENSMQARIKNGWLSCHYCGTRIRVPDTCPECGSRHIQFLGLGTQRAEEELHKLFPNAVIMRMDADTTSSKQSFDNMLERFRNGEADILIGTQMVTKGHDFPNVTCVGIISADNSLYMDDYKARERAFDLITQVSGRAGRGDKKGVAVIQTYSPDNRTVKFAANQNYLDFYNDEIQIRRAYEFPPFCDIMLINLISASEPELLKASVELTKKIKELATGKYKGIPLKLFGPFEASLYKINEKYRMQAVIKCKNTKETRALFAELQISCIKDMGRKVNMTFDMNPAVV